MRIVELDPITEEEIESTIFEIGEATGLLAEDAALVVFAPEIAATAGIAWVAKTIWDFYGDRITREIERLPKHIYNRAKDLVKGSGRPRKVAGRKSGRKEKTSPVRIEGKRKKPNRRARETSPVNAEKDVEQKMQEAENPPPPNAQTVIPKMGKWTSFPNTTACVDLGTMELNPKGGPGGDHIYENDLVGEWTQFRSMYERLYTTSGDGKLWQMLSESEIVMSQEDSQSTPANMGTDGQTTPQVHKFRTKFSKTANYRNCSFNSAMTIHEILENMPYDKMGTQLTYVYPVPNGGTYEDQFYETNDAFMMIGIKNQYVELHFKNLTNSLIDSNENDAGTTVDTNNDKVPASPAKITVRIIQAKEDIPVNADNDGTISNHYNTDVGAGWTRYQDRSRSDIVPASNNFKSYLVRYGDNSYLKEYWEIVSKKDFCLCVGQEGTLKIGLPKKQVLSTQYMLNARKGTLLSGTPGTDAVWRYKTPYIKKGEQQVLIEVHGGIGLAQETGNNANYSINVCPTQVGVLWTHTYEYCVISTSNTQIVIKDNNITKNAYTNYGQDSDINNAQKD